jgi:hypothetical protein
MTFGIGHPDHRIASRMGAAGAEDVDAAVAEIDGHRLRKGRGGPCQAGDFLMPSKEAREAGELAVPILLPALGDHGARGVGHDDLTGAIGRGAENAHGVVMGQARWLMGLSVTADAVDHLSRKARRGLRLDDHHAVVADDDAGIGIALGREGVKARADLAEADRLFGQVARAGEGLGHVIPPRRRKSRLFRSGSAGKSASLLPRRPVELLLQRRPAVDVIVLQRRLLRRELRQVLRKAGLEHEGHRVVELVGLQLRVRRALEGVASGPCGSIMLCRLIPPGTKPCGLASYWP